MGSRNYDGTKIQQDTYVTRHVEHSIQRSDYTTDTKVEEFDEELPT